MTSRERREAPKIPRGPVDRQEHALPITALEGYMATIAGTMIRTWRLPLVSAGVVQRICAKTDPRVARSKGAHSDAVKPPSQDGRSKKNRTRPRIRVCGAAAAPFQRPKSATNRDSTLKEMGLKTRYPDYGGTNAGKGETCQKPVAMYQFAEARSRSIAHLNWQTGPD